MQWSGAVPQPAQGPALPTSACSGISGPITSGGHRRPHRGIPGAPVPGSRWDGTSEPCGHLLSKATLSTLGEVADFPNTQEQTQRTGQKVETEEYVPIKRTRQNLREKTKQNQTKLARLAKKKENSNKIRNEREVASDTTEIRRILRDCHT